MFGRQATIPIDVDLQKHSVEECKEWYLSAEQPDVSVMAAEHAHLLKEAMIKFGDRVQPCATH